MHKIVAAFLGTPIGELLSGSAHDAHPTDITAALGARFAGKSILAIHVAQKLAATARVSFDKEGRATLGMVRNISNRHSHEFAQTISSEAAAADTKWSVVILQTGWQAVIGQRAARSSHDEPATPFFRHKLLFDTPELAVTRAESGRVYTAVDHPFLDKSIVFSVQTKELEGILSEIRGVGMMVASVRISIASQLENWFATQGEKALERDILLTDGLSSLLLNIDPQSQSFIPPQGSEVAEMPRQAVQRPSALVDDITRHLAQNLGREINYIGPEEICAGIKAKAPNVQLVRPPDHVAHDVQKAVFSSASLHDLNYEVREVRQALPRKMRRLVMAYCAIVLAALFAGGYHIAYAIRGSYEAFQLEREESRRAGAAQAAAQTINAMASDFTDVSVLRAWLGSNYHAQAFCYQLLKAVPADVALDSLKVEMKDGQMTLTFVLLGESDPVQGAIRAIEKVIVDQKFKIGRSEPPIALSGPSRSVQCRMHIIVPDAGEVSP